MRTSYACPPPRRNQPRPCGRVDAVSRGRLEPEGRGTRLFLEHDGSDPDNPVQLLSRRIMGDTGWRGTARRIGKVLSELPS